MKYYNIFLLSMLMLTFGNDSYIASSNETKNFQEFLASLPESNRTKFIEIANKKSRTKEEQEFFLSIVAKYQESHSNKRLSEELPPEIQKNLLELQHRPTYPQPYDPICDRPIVNILEKIINIDEDHKTLNPGFQDISMTLAAKAPVYQLTSKGLSVFNDWPTLLNGQRLSAWVNADSGKNEHTITVIKSDTYPDKYEVTINSDSASTRAHDHNNAGHAELTKAIKDANGYSKFTDLEKEPMSSIQGEVKATCYHHGCDAIVKFIIAPQVLTYLIQEKNSNKHLNNNFPTK